MSGYENATGELSVSECTDPNQRRCTRRELFRKKTPKRKLSVQARVKEMDHLNCPESTVDLCTDCPKELPSSKFDCLPESALEGPISLSHTFFLHKKIVKDWTVFHCRNCGIVTHAVRNEQIGDNRKILVGKEMEKDAAVLERLRRSTAFSPAFQIVLNTDVPFTGTMPAPQYFESLQNQLSMLQTQMDTYLMEEENEMEERIRKYETQQKAMFEEVQERAKEDKKKLITMLLSVMDAINAEKEVEVDKSENSCASGYQSSELPSTPSEIKNDFHSKSESTGSDKQLLATPSGEFDLESDGMFYMSGDDRGDDSEPFYFSDDDDFALDSSTEVTFPSYSSKNTRKNNLNKEVMMSSSVPVNVPRGGQSVYRSSGGEKDDFSPPPHDPQEMAASMRALAESLRKDEGFIFGDLPRPRLNTGDISITRPTRLL